MTASFTHVFNAGLWNAPSGSWDALIRSLAADGSVASVTETTHQHPDAPRGWGRSWFRAPGAFECSVYWDESVWTRVADEADQIATERYALGGSADKPALHALAVLLEHKATGHRVLFVVVHWPSAIEALVSKDPNGKVSRFPRITALFQGLSGLRTVLRHQRKANPGHSVVVSADWNLDVHKAWVRAFLRAHFPTLSLSWHALPAGGDEGKRLISASLYSRGLTTTGSRLGRHFKPFDHARFVTKYGFAKAHKAKGK